MLGLLAANSMSLTPRTESWSVRGLQFCPPSVLSQTPPLPAPARIRFESLGETATQFTRPRLGSRMVLLPTSLSCVGPTGCQFETAVGASGAAGARGAVTAKGAAPKP